MPPVAEGKPDAAATDVVSGTKKAARSKKQAEPVAEVPIADASEEPAPVVSLKKAKKKGASTETAQKKTKGAN